MAVTQHDHIHHIFFLVFYILDAFGLENLNIIVFYPKAEGIKFDAMPLPIVKRNVDFLILKEQ